MIPFNQVLYDGVFSLVIFPTFVMVWKKRKLIICCSKKAPAEIIEEWTIFWKSKNWISFESFSIEVINFQLNSNGFQRFAWADKRSAWMMYRKPRERAQQIIFNWMNAHKNTHTHARAREHTWEMSSRSVLACDECALRANYQTHDHQMCTLSVFYVCCVTNNLFCWAHCFFNLLFVCFFFIWFWFQCEISSARCIWKFCECDAEKERKWSVPMEPIKLTAQQHTIW